MYPGYDKDVFFPSGRFWKAHIWFVVHIHAVTGPPNTEGNSGHAVLLKVFIHESIYNRIVERIWKSYGLCDGNNHIDGDVIIFLAQVTLKQNSKVQLKGVTDCNVHWYIFKHSLTVLKQHVNGVKRCPADSKQYDNSDHHLDRSSLLSVPWRKRMAFWEVTCNESEM